ncbi:MAG: SGNH/GDSL hydrolase family protein, partial [Candidatus Gallimonas sp.]
PVTEIADLTDEEHVNLYGRTYYNESMQGRAFVNSASGFEVRFRGTELSMQAQSNYISGWESRISVYVDGETDSNARVVTVKSSMLATYARVVLAENLAEGEHTVKVLKRLPSNKDTVLVSALSTDGEFLSAPARPQTKIEFFGDSITCGYGVMRDVSGGDRNNNTNETTNAMLSYAGIAAQQLSADWRIYGRDGIAMRYPYSSGGITVSENPAAVAVDLDSEEYPYDYNSWTPDAVVIYLGTNDYNARNAAHNSFSMEALKISFVQFIRDVVGYYYGKEIPIVLCSGQMVAGSGLDECMRGVKSMLVSEFPNLDTLEFAACASNHPIVEEARVAGNLLAEKLKGMLNLA